MKCSRPCCKRWRAQTDTVFLNRAEWQQHLCKRWGCESHHCMFTQLFGQCIAGCTVWSLQRPAGRLASLSSPKLCQTPHTPLACEPVLLPLVWWEEPWKTAWASPGLSPHSISPSPTHPPTLPHKASDHGTGESKWIKLCSEVWGWLALNLTGEMIWASV